MLGKGLARIGAPRRVGLELVHQHRRPGDPFEGRAAHELEAALGLDHAHGMARLGGEPDQLDGLVGGYPAGDSDQDPRHAQRRPTGSGT